MTLKRYAVWVILICAFFGIAVSSYLASSEAQGAPLICNIESLSGCNVVVNSAYSQFMGISLADIGLFFYTILFILAAFELFQMNHLLRHLLQGLALVAILSSVYSVYTQAFLIKAYCVYCLTSVLLTVIIFIAATLIEPVPIHRLKQVRAIISKP